MNDYQRHTITFDSPREEFSADCASIADGKHVHRITAGADHARVVARMSEGETATGAAGPDSSPSVPSTAGSQSRPGPLSLAAHFYRRAIERGWRG